MLRQRFVIVFPDNSMIECDTVVSIEHSIEAQASKFRVETGAKRTDHTVVDPKTSKIEAIVSDTPLDQLLQPQNPNRSQRAFDMLEKALTDRPIVSVFAGRRYYPQAIITLFSGTDNIDNLGQLRFNCAVQEFVETTVQTVQVRRVAKPSNHKPKAKLGTKFADKIKAVAEGKAAGV